MKPSFEQLTDNADHSFSVKRVIRERRNDLASAGVWHYHEGFEITLTTTSKGQRFIGYDYEDYASLDLVLIGENIPHCWITEEHTEQVVINFKNDFLGGGMWNKPELKEINHLLDQSKRGIKFSTEVIDQASKLILEMEQSQGFSRLMSLFELLELLAHDKEKKYLSSYNERTKGNRKLSSRIEKIYSYVLNNYKDPDISQAALASELNMTSSSFCKFVKNMTRKTFYQLILEARISHACSLLVDTDKYVSEICYLSGFKNISNFNRIFKRIMKQSPLDYRKSYS